MAIEDGAVRAPLTKAIGDVLRDMGATSANVDTDTLAGMILDGLPADALVATAPAPDPAPAPVPEPPVPAP